MKDTSPVIELRREKPVYQQIETLIRSDIVSGVLACGSRLPSVQSLARQYQTSVFTIHTALDCLAEDGLIDRVRGRGTLVTSTSKKMNHVAVYFGADFWHGGGMDYYRGLYERLSGELDGRNVKHRLIVDTRPAAKQAEPLPELVEAASRRLIQGVIVGITKPVEMSWLTKLGLPLAVSGSAPISARVGSDSDQFFDLALGDLRDRGCRTVGLISPMWIDKHPEEPSSGDIERFFNSFVERLDGFGLTTKNSWVRTPRKPLLNTGHEAFGYREFHEIWKQKDRPEGLIVYPDTVVRGAVTAILRESVAVPEDLKLVFHRNESMICPVEASWLVWDIGDVADALIGLLERQIAGQEVEPIRLPFCFEKASPQNGCPGKSQKLKSDRNNRRNPERIP